MELKEAIKQERLASVENNKYLLEVEIGDFVDVNELYKNSIPKQKIEDKIEEYKNLIDDISESEQYSHEIPLYKHDIQVLQELLEVKDEQN